MPQAMSARATWLDRASSCANVISWSPTTAAIRPGTARAAFRKTSPISRSTLAPCLPLRNGDLRIEGPVLPPPSGTSISESLTRRAVERAVAGRQASYAEELQRIVEATYRVIERTGTVD